jgi:uncharacterized membrane protein YhaH (DUF805 family)
MPEWVLASSVRGLFPQLPPPLPKLSGSSTLDASPIGRTGGATLEVSASGKPLSFIEAARKGLSKLFDFEGRATRSELWWFYLLTLLVWVPLVFIAVMVGLPIRWMQFLGYIYYVVVMSGVGSRRLHDVDRSGWWQLVFVTVIGGIVLFIWFCRKGSSGPNRFGPSVSGGAGLRG